MLHTRFALRRPVTTLMTFIAVSLIGLIATTLLPLELFPDIRFPGISVNIPYDGSTPEEVEQLITRPAEEAIATLSGIKEIRSTSSENGSEIVVFFEWDRDPAAVGFEVRTKLESIRHEFPPSANRILTRMFAAGDDRVVAVRIASHEDLSRQYDMLDRYLKRPLERLDGVARVSLEGVEPLELRILADPARLAAHGVDVARLRDSLQGANFSVSAGEVTGGQQRFLVRPIGEFRTLDDVRNFIVDGNLRLRPEWEGLDTRCRFDIDLASLWDYAPAALGQDCLCGDIMAGIATPHDCPLYGRECVPGKPVGACMVSSEGTCRIWHQYGGHPDLGRPSARWAGGGAGNAPEGSAG